MRGFNKERTFFERGRSLSKMSNSFPYIYQARQNVSQVVDEIVIGIKTHPYYLAGKPMIFNVSKPPIAVILGKRGTGKTVLMKTILSELFYGGYLVMVIPDPRNEYSLAKYPIQPVFYKNINPERQDPSFLTGIETNAFSPLFFSTLNYGKLPEGTKPFQFDVKDADERDWIKLLNLEQSGLYAQLRAFRSFYLNTLNMPSEKTTEYLQNITNEKLPGIQFPTKEKLQENIRQLFRVGVFGSRYKLDLVKSLLSGIVAICTEGNEGVEDTLYKETIAMLFRKLFFLKRDNSQIKNKRLALFHEEAWDIMPSMGEPPSKTEGTRLARLGRINYIAQYMNYQYLGDVPLFFKEQASVAFFNGSLSQNLQDEVMDKFNVSEDAREQLMFFPLKERNNVREWAMVTEGKMERFIPYAPTIMLKLQVK